MKQWNHRLVIIIGVLLGLHGILGSFMLLGWSTVSLPLVAWILTGLVCLHAGMGIAASLPAVAVARNTGVWYWRNNQKFWIQRLSGLSILILLIIHINAYTSTVGEQFFLQEFTVCHMAGQILFILSLSIHIASSMKSFFVLQGSLQVQNRTLDGMCILTILMLLCTVAVVVYYIQWQW